MGRIPLGPVADGIPDLASSASQSDARDLAPAGDRFGDRRRSPVSKLRIPLRQANVLLFFTLKQQMFQPFSRFTAGAAENCLRRPNPVMSAPFAKANSIPFYVWSFHAAATPQ